MLLDDREKDCLSAHAAYPLSSSALITRSGEGVRFVRKFDRLIEQLAVEHLVEQTAEEWTCGIAPTSQCHLLKTLSNL
jgi:hypothetical protein